nr:single-stranded DNA-binding protein [uncultured archaeon]
MASVNKVILVGRVGANPELKNFEGGSKVVNFAIATSENFKDKAGVKQQKTEWHNIVAWAEKAELISKYVSKGSLVYIEGKLQTRSWDDKDGVKRYTTEVNAFTIEFLDSKKSEDGETSTKTEAPTKTVTPVNVKTAGKTTATAATVTTGSDSDDDLPF